MKPKCTDCKKASKSGELNCHDAKKIGRDFALGLLAAVSSAFLLNIDQIQILFVKLVTESLELSNLLVVVPFVTAIIATLFGGIRRFLADNKK